MGANSHLETAIQIATSLKQDLEALSDLFGQLMPIIDKEHLAIKESQLVELEYLTAAKEELGASISERSESLLKSGEDLRRLYKIVTQSEAPKGAGMKECLQWLQEIRLSLGQDGLAVQVLTHIEQKLNASYTALVEKKKASQGKIEINTYLTRELLSCHRENIRMIQEMVAQANSTYSPAGTTRAQEPRSVLTVKA